MERTIGSLKNFVLTYAKEKDHDNLETMVEFALSAPRFAPNATLKITLFEAHYDREANTFLRNLTKKPSLQNLNWEKVLKQKSARLDSNEERASNLPHPRATNWAETSDAEYDVEHINHPRKLAEDQLVAIADKGPAPRDTNRNGNSEGIKKPESEKQTPRCPSRRKELLFQRIKDHNQSINHKNKK